MAENIVIKIIGEDHFSATAQKVSSSMKNMGRDVTNAGRTLSMGITLPLIGAGTASVLAASNLEESMNKTRVVFGQAAESVIAFASTAATKLGMSQQAALEAAGTFGNLFTSMGLGLPAAAEMSQGLVQLASDLASFNNISPEVALEKLRAGLVGEVEPLRTLGVNLSADAVYARALAMGLAKTKEELTPAMLAQARYAIILEQTKNAQGDFARTSDSLANSLRMSKAQLTDAAAKIGTMLIPVVIKLLDAITPLIKKFSEMNPETQKTILIIAGIAAAIGPLLVIVGQLITAIGAIIPVVTAVAGVLSGPVLAVIAAVAAGVALLYLAWKNNFLGIQQTVKAVFDAIKLVWAAFKAAFEGDWKGFGENLKAAWNVLWELISQRIARAWEDIKNFCANIINSIITFFRDTDWGSVGKAIIDGIAAGISAGASAIINAAKAAAQAALDAAKRLLGIKSPSSVFAGVGKNMMLGMAQGIVHNQHVPAFAAAGAAYNTTKAVTDARVFNFNYSGQASQQSVYQAYEMAKLLG